MDQVQSNQETDQFEIPKPELEEPKGRSNVWLKSLTSLGFFIIAGFFFFGQNWTLVLILTGVVVFHEFGHFVAMKIYKYQDLGMYFIPLLGAYVSGKKQEVSQMQSAIILMAGPIPGIFLGIIIHFVAINTGIVDLERTAWIMIFLNVLNLLPVYPLDGGQLLHRLFLDEYNILGKIFVFISAAFMVWVAIKFDFYLLLFFPFMMISRFIGDLQHERMVKKVEAEGVDLMKSYEELTAEEYWHIRNIIIKHNPQLKDVKPSPPFEISPKEEQIINIIQGLLQRSLIQDISLGSKLIILIIWIGFFIAPFFIKNPYFGF